VHSRKRKQFINSKPGTQLTQIQSQRVGKSEGCLRQRSPGDLNRAYKSVEVSIPQRGGETPRKRFIIKRKATLEEGEGAEPRCIVIPPRDKKKKEILMSQEKERRVSYLEKTKGIEKDGVLRLLLRELKTSVGLASSEGTGT